MTAVDAFVAMVAITVLAALRRNERSRRCTIECCLSLKVAGSIAANRRTMVSAVSWGSAASSSRSRPDADRVWRASASVSCTDACEHDVWRAPRRAWPPYRARAKRQWISRRCTTCHGKVPFADAIAERRAPPRSGLGGERKCHTHFRKGDRLRRQSQRPSPRADCRELRPDDHFTGPVRP